MWIPRVQYKTRVKNKIPSATLEEIADAALRPFEPPTGRGDNDDDNGDNDDDNSDNDDVIVYEV